LTFRNVPALLSVKPKQSRIGRWVEAGMGKQVVTARQAELLRDVARDGGFDFLDPADYWSSGALGFRNRERVIEALQRKGLLDGDKVTEMGLRVLAALSEPQA